MKLEKAYRRDSKLKRRKNSSKNNALKNRDELKKINVEKIIDRKRKEKEKWIDDILDNYSYDDSMDNDYE